MNKNSQRQVTALQFTKPKIAKVDFYKHMA